jgi:anti-sigma-K factor RskA
MNCAPEVRDYDLRDYYFGVLSPADRRKVDEHLSGCEQCSTELDRLRLTAAALNALPQEEIPRRIGFVSDKVFQPSSVSRWWQMVWMSGARTASLAVALLAVAILIHAFRPQPAAPRTSIAPVAAGQVSYDPGALQAAVDQAVAKAVAKTESRYDLKLEAVMAENRQQRRMIELAAEAIDTMDRHNRVMTVAANRPPLAEGQ